MKLGITCYPTYGGSGAVATELGLDLARRGHEVHFITYDSPFRLRGYTERVFFHQVDTRMGRYPLFDHFPYTLALASKQHEVVLRESLALSVVGVLLGLVILVAVGGLTARLVYGLSPRDPGTIAIATDTLLVVTIVAALIPAWRASRIDPVDAIRSG